ncbi:hypothetical protein [Bdellovibrio sp. BCCA]|uniref:hypothetical protein n=1 Tax=Bdellovibrio sp. BCCA TaxID=3136281 RepID=UPI0030F16A3B
MKKLFSLLTLSVLLTAQLSHATRKDGQEAHGTVGNKFCEELAKVIDLRYSPFADECREYIRDEKKSDSPATTPQK